MTTKRVQWILASASPRRQEILRGLGLAFEVHPSTSPEPGIRPGENPISYAVRAARAKAREVGQEHDAGLVVSADTIVVRGRRLMGKPESRRDAEGMLRLLSGAWHKVVTGVCLHDCRTRVQRSSHAVSGVHFRRLSASEMAWYLDTGEYRDKAGAYAIQGYASLFIDRIEGCYFNIVGFPVFTFDRLCSKMGIELIRELTVNS